MTAFQTKTSVSKTQEKKTESRKSSSPLPQNQLTSAGNIMPPTLLLNKTCAIVTKTLRPAPDGTPDTRTVVGVGEEVEMTLPTSAKWSASAGTIFPAEGSQVTWKAPATDMNVEINATLAKNHKCSCLMTVQAPNNLSMTLDHVETFPKPKPTPGAGMWCLVTILPRNICLGATQWREDLGPTTKIKGYFSKLPTQYHIPNLAYVPIMDTNICENLDHPSGIYPPPYEPGSFQWEIPNRYKLDNEPDGKGRLFATTIQAFTISEWGTITVSKQGAFVARSPISP